MLFLDEKKNKKKLKLLNVNIVIAFDVYFNKRKNSLMTFPLDGS